MNTNEEQLDEEKKKFLLKHWKMALVMAANFVAAAIVGLFVFLWVMTEAIVPVGSFPVGLGDWTVGLIISFALNVIFWELVFVATWVIPCVVGYYWWFNKQPDADIWKPGRGRREGGDAFGFLIAVAWLIMIYVDDRWNQTLSTWTFTEWIYSWLTALGWVLLIFGIPAVIIFILWFVKREMEKETKSSTETADTVVDEPSEETTD